MMDEILKWIDDYHNGMAENFYGTVSFKTLHLAP